MNIYTIVHNNNVTFGCTTNKNNNNANIYVDNMLQVCILHSV